MSTVAHCVFALYAIHQKQSMTGANDSLREDSGEGKKTRVSQRRSKRKTVNSCFLPPSLCSSQEIVPCDLPDPSLWLTEGTRALFISLLTWLCAPPPPACLTDASLPGGKDGWAGECRGGLHQGETLPVGSRQFQAIAPCSLGFYLHTRVHTQLSMRRQMTFNGCDNVACFLAVQLRVLFFKSCCANTNCYCNRYP